MNKKKRHFHRNSGPKKIRNKVYRKMYKDPELLQSDREGLLVDENWNIYDPYNPFLQWEKPEGTYYCDNNNYDWDYTYDTEHDYHLLKVMDDIITSVSNISLQNKSLIEKVDTERVINEFGKSKNEYAFSLDELQTFLNNIHSPKFRRLHLHDYVKEAVGHPLNILLLYQFSKELKNPEKCHLLLLFSPFWIRPPLSWKRDSGISLVDHLFVLYPTPCYLYYTWNETCQLHFTWLSWFLTIAQGGSIKKAARIFGWRFSSKNLLYLFEADESLTPIEAYIFAEIKRNNGSDRVVNLILNCPSFIIDLTNPTTEDDFIDFWRNSVQWLIRHENDLTDLQANHVLDWAVHEFTESGMFGNRRFSWRGRSLHQILERSAEYQRMMWRPYQMMRHGGKYLPLSWDKNNLDWAFEDENLNEWTFTELNNSKELLEEGSGLLHCVGSYSSRCLAGNSAIVSLRKNGERSITIELNPGNKTLIQACGNRNRSADENEMKIIREWLKFIKIAKYC